MTLDELKASEADTETEVIDIEEEVDEDDGSLEQNLLEACAQIDKLLTMMEQIVIVPKGRAVKRLPRHFTDVMEEAHEFLEDLEYQRDDDAEE